MRKPIIIGMTLLVMAAALGACVSASSERGRVVPARIERVDMPLIDHKSQAIVVGGVPYFVTGLVDDIPKQRRPVAVLSQAGRVGEAEFRRGATVYWPMAGVDNVRDWYEATGADFDYAFDTGPRMMSEDYLEGVSLYLPSVSGPWVRLQPLEMRSVLGDYVVTAKRVRVSRVKEIAVPRNVFDEAERTHFKASEYYVDYGFSHLYRAGRGRPRTIYYRDRSMPRGSYVVVIPRRRYLATLPRRNDSVVKGKTVRRVIRFPVTGKAQRRVVRFEVPYTWSVIDEGYPESARGAAELDFYVVEPGDKAGIHVIAREVAAGGYEPGDASENDKPVLLGEFPAKQTAARRGQNSYEVTAAPDGAQVSISLSAPAGTPARYRRVFEQVLRTFTMRRR